MLFTAPPAWAETGDPTAVTAAVDGLNVNVGWTADSSSDVTGYLISTEPTSPEVTVPADAESAVLTGLRPNVDYTVQVSAVRDAGAGDAIAAENAVRITAPGGSFTGVTPTRLLDTRIGVGAPVGATREVLLQITGAGPVPADGVSAVALNVTVTRSVAGGYVSAYPAGQARPVVSNVNYTRAQTKANLVIVPVGTNGRVVLYSSATTHLVADVSGYFSDPETAASAAGLFNSIQPNRVMDTRNGFGASTPGPQGQVKVKVTGKGGVPEDNVSSIVLNTTVVNPSAAGFVTAYPTDANLPQASTINFVAGQTVANRTIVPVGSDGYVTFFNRSGRTPIVVDVTGWFTADQDESASGSYFVPLAPTRIVDTRLGVGAPKSRVAARSLIAVGIAGLQSIPSITNDTPPIAAVTTLTLVGPSTSTYGTVYPSLSARPNASDVNATARTNVPNLALPGLGADGKIAIYNHSGSTDMVVDLSGYFIGNVHVPDSTVVISNAQLEDVQGDPADTAEVTLAADAPEVEIGQILAAGVTTQTPTGLLVKVVAVTVNGSGQQVVQTEPGTLAEALGSGEFAINAPLSGDDVVEAEGVAAPRAKGRTKVLTTEDLAERQAGALAATPVEGNKTKLTCAADADSFVETDFSIEPTLNVKVKLGWSGFRPSASAEAYAQLRQTSGIAIGYRGSANCDLSRELAKFTFPALKFTVGPVPVVIVPQLRVTAKANLDGTAEIATSVRQEFLAKAGVAYDGEATKPIKEISNTFTYEPLQLTEVKGSASATLGAELIGKIYGITGPTVTVEPTLRATIDPLDDPFWIVVLEVKGKAGLKLDVSVINISVEVEVDLYRKVLAKAGGDPTPDVPVSLTFDELPLGTPITDNYRPLGIHFGGDTTPFLTTDSANPTSPVLSGGAGFGSPLFGEFVNQDGSARTVNSLVLDVGYIDDPGSTEVLIYNTAGQLLETKVADSVGIDTITFTRNGIFSFVVRSTGVERSGWAIDNVEFGGFTGTPHDAARDVALVAKKGSGTTKA